ncbi:GLPGLI family protein [Thermonema lapsum]|uniref:GLPGLI family protein n=1 Tax=Thermonema lapsum TaxID=28195 RepID=A0A846MNL8_9BACT|nr:GLPGLI family protein [Thermonema lapsum]NIK73002.1 GLPGLI family protein [Thermonema lapsum]
MKGKNFFLLAAVLFSVSLFEAFGQTTSSYLHLVYKIQDLRYSLPYEAHAYLTADRALFTLRRPARTYKAELPEFPNLEVDEPFNAFDVCVNYLDKKVTYRRKFKDSSAIYAVEPVLELRWQFTGKQKEILGYPCQEAVLTVQEVARHPLLEYEQRKIRVVDYHFWYTTAIPARDGYLFYTGLPGVVLQVVISSSRGEHVLVEAQKVEKANGYVLSCDSLQEGEAVESIKEAHYWEFYSRYEKEKRKRKK